MKHLCLESDTRLCCSGLKVFEQVAAAPAVNFGDSDQVVKMSPDDRVNVFVRIM